MTTMSQDEINAMLSGVDTVVGDNAEGAVMGSAAADDAPTLAAQADERADSDGAVPSTLISFDGNDPQWRLSAEEIDVLGEIGNICMGAGATTLYTLLDRRCEITTPKVSVHTTHQLLREYATPFVAVEVEYVEGIDGKNLLLLKEKDAAMITDVLMGGEGNVAEPVELSELHMSAISEVMNQMIGASATAMAKVLGIPVNISTPQSVWVNQDKDVGEYLDRSQVVVKVSFDMEIEGLLSSQLLQMIPFDLSRSLVQRVQEIGGVTAPAQENASAQPELAAVPPQAAMPAAPLQNTAPPQSVQYAQPPVQAATTAYYQQPAYAPPPAAAQTTSMVDVRPMQYNSFDERPAAQNQGSRGMGLVHDIPLTVSVELGKTKKDISEILEFGLGSVVVLDKIAGDPVEVMVNGKLIARGEVVIIDENYGVRITDIVNG